MSLSGRDLRRFYWQVYRDAAPVDRLLATWRPAICPFEPIVGVVPPDARVLDFGCGVGALLMLLAATRRIKAGIGCDLSARALAAAARASAKISAVDLEFRRIASTADVPLGPFDAAMMVDVMHHMPRTSQEDTILAIAERVKKGGRLIYKDIAMRPAWRRIGNTMHDLLVARQLVNYVPIADVKGWMQSAGFVVSHSQRYARLIYGHELLVFERR